MRDVERSLRQAYAEMYLSASLNLCRIGFIDRTRWIGIHEPFHPGLIRIPIERPLQGISQGLPLAVQDFLEVTLDLKGCRVNTIGVKGG